MLRRGEAARDRSLREMLRGRAVFFFATAFTRWPMRGSVSLSVATLALVAGGFAGPPEPKSVALGESFELKAGDSAQIEAEALVIGFEGVSADSRCPKGEQCIWEGDATVRVWLRKASGAKETRELHTSSKEPGTLSYQGYGVGLVRLDPHPVSGKAIAQDDYRATLEVTRGSPADLDR